MASEVSACTHVKGTRGLRCATGRNLDGAGGVASTARKPTELRALLMFLCCSLHHSDRANLLRVTQEAALPVRVAQARPRKSPRLRLHCEPALSSTAACSSAAYSSVHGFSQ